MPLKTRQVNIGIEVEPKFAKIRDYWDDSTVDKVAEFLHEYQDLFPTKFSNLKGIIGDLGVKKITLKLDMKHIKKRSAWSWTRCLQQVLLNWWRNLIG